MSYKIITSTAFSLLTIVKFMFLLTLTTRMMMLSIPFGKSVYLNNKSMIKGNPEKTEVLHFTSRFMRQPSKSLPLQELKLILKRKLET